MEQEQLTLWLALLAYVGAGILAIFGTVFGRRPERTVLALLVVGLVLQTLAIGLRWERLGHGPYVTMFEILSSNVWSLKRGFGNPKIKPLLISLPHKSCGRSQNKEARLIHQGSHS